jgi:hypothetical protein
MKGGKSFYERKKYFVSSRIAKERLDASKHYSVNLSKQIKGKITL